MQEATTDDESIAEQLVISSYQWYHVYREIYVNVPQQIRHAAPVHIRTFDLLIESS